jgi:flagellar biosynthesis/type III secretory pathway protein FliH
VVEYQQKVDQLEGEKDMRYISSLERLGMEKGFQQGLEQGLQKGEATLLIRQLQHRFHYLPDSYITKIQQANDSMLLTWGERLLDATALEDIFD